MLEELQLPKQPALSLKSLIAVLTAIESRGAVCTMKPENLAKQARVGRRTLYRILDALDDLGVICREPVEGDRRKRRLWVDWDELAMVHETTVNQCQNSATMAPKSDGIQCHHGTESVPPWHRSPDHTLYREPKREPNNGSLFGDTDEQALKVDLKNQSSPNSAQGEFNRFWEVCRRKEGKQAARRAFTKARKDYPLAHIIALAEKYYATFSETDLQFAKHPATFLNQCLEDDPADWVRRTSHKQRRTGQDLQDRIAEVGMEWLASKGHQEPERPQLQVIGDWRAAQ